MLHYRHILTARGGGRVLHYRYFLTAGVGVGCYIICTFSPFGTMLSLGFSDASVAHGSPAQQC